MQRWMWVRGVRLASDGGKWRACSLEGGLVMEEVEVVTLRYVCEVRSPGALHVLLNSVSADASLLLENRSGQPVRYRQAHIAGLPFLPLPPFSAAGFAWQASDRPINREVASLASFLPLHYSFQCCCSPRRPVENRCFCTKFDTRQISNQGSVFPSLNYWCIHAAR
jgi:hypothetical protein